MASESMTVPVAIPKHNDSSSVGLSSFLATNLCGDKDSASLYGVALLMVTI